MIHCSCFMCLSLLYTYSSVKKSAALVAYIFSDEREVENDFSALKFFFYNAVSLSNEIAVNS